MLHSVIKFGQSLEINRREGSEFVKVPMVRLEGFAWVDFAQNMCDVLRHSGGKASRR